MLTSALATAYGVGIAGIMYNFGRIKLLNDYEEDIKSMRQYDFTYESLNPHDMPRRALVLLNVDHNDHNLSFEKEPVLESSRAAFAQHHPGTDVSAEKESGEELADDEIKEKRVLLFSRVDNYSAQSEPP